MVTDNDIKWLRKIAEFEDNNDVTEMRRGWAFRHVGIHGSILSNLCLKGYLDNISRSNSYTGYRLNERGRAAITETKAKRDETQKRCDAPLPNDLFDDIIGHDDIKELLRACLLAERPVHVLLTGPPALAKTLFLWDIERAVGNDAIWAIGYATSKGGLWDIIAEEEPRFILIDELDKMTATDTAALLSLMEGGRLVRIKVGRELNMENEVRVVAACNRLDRLSPELISRFAVCRIRPYTRQDYLTVVKGVLERREGLTAEVAEEIAHALDGRTQDVRDAIKVARLVPQFGVRKTIQLLSGGFQWRENMTEKQI